MGGNTEEIPHKFNRNDVSFDEPEKLPDRLVLHETNVPKNHRLVFCAKNGWNGYLIQVSFVWILSHKSMFYSYLSPRNPNNIENKNFAKLGNDAKVPVDTKLNPRALDTYLGPAVRMK